MKERERTIRLAELAEEEKKRELEVRKLAEEEKKRELEARRLAIEEKKLELAKHEIDHRDLDTSYELKYSELRKMPKMPVFHDGEDITAYLIRFENLAVLSQWPEDSWATRLALLFSGTALNVYSTLSDEVIADYSELKKAILKAFKKTTDQYRKEFRFAKITSNQNYSQFLTNIFRLFDYWIESAEIDKTYASLRDFLVADQFLTALPNEIRTFLKENDIRTARDMAESADNYASAHRCYPEDKRVGKVKSGKEDKTAKTTSESHSENRYANVRCFNCGEKGHTRPNCTQRKFSEQKIRQCFDDADEFAPFCSGTINGSNVSTILRDTGCTCVVVSSKVLPNIKPSNYPKLKLTDYLGRSDEFPVVRCYLKCQWYKGWVDAVVAPIKFCSVLLGNIDGASFPTDCRNNSGSLSIVPTPNVLLDETKSAPNQITSNVHSDQFECNKVNAVTRSQNKNKLIHPLILPKVEALNISPVEFKNLQASCDSLENIRQLAVNGQTVVRKNYSYKIMYRNGILYKQILSSKNPNEVGKNKLVIPSECRLIILKLSHDLPVAGHFSHRKTLMKIQDLYFWPRMSSDVINYCRSCDVCQRFSSKGRVKKAQLMKMPIVSVPFEKVAIDIVGPFSPCSSDGHRYILTLVDYATSFPEAVPLKNITSIDIAEALLSIFARVGIPKQILSDRGTQFTSDLMDKVYELIGVKPIFTTPYHPMANGRIERQHSILKSILKKLCHVKPKEWHRYIPCALFAMREIPSDSLGFSPFELLYGRQARGPLSILNDLWTKPDLNLETQSSYKFLLDLRERLQETAELASNNQATSMKQCKTYFDVKSSNRSLKADDEVLVLLPDSSNKLLMSWNGPFKVIKAVNKVDYLLDVKGKHKLYHINLLKKYYRRDKMCFNVVDENDVDPIFKPFVSDNIVNVCVLEPTDSESDEDIITVPDSVVADIDICPDLSSKHLLEIKQVVTGYNDVFSELPGCTNTVVHKIKLTTDDPFRSKVYPVPVHLRDEFNKEVDRLLELQIIEPSDSPYCSPVVMIRKPDKSFRLAQDFRALNSITKFDAEPMPNIEDDLYKFNNAKFITEIDITKAYHQVLLDPDSRKYTAFPTYKGLMQYRRMPFGLVTACATFIRLMRKVFNSIDVCVYFDNIFVISDDWFHHLKTLRVVLERLRSHGLTARTSKCHIAYPQVKYLGFNISRNFLSPLPEKLDVILKFECPKSKKQLRSFLGVANFYRKFIPNMSDLTSPLSEKLKKMAKEPLQWTANEVKCFNLIKQHFNSELILRLPDITKPFCLRTDASSTGLGAVLLQYHEDIAHPVSFSSRKLLPREQNYATVERECLAIVWAIHKFQYYLYGRPFLLETDHKPLSYLETIKNSNKRLLRWALSLKPFKFQITYIPGSMNHFPDLLSRSV